jgi:hypothetical protein
MIDNRQVTALRKLANNFTSLNASRFNRQPECRSRKSTIALAAVGYPVGDIARSIGHIVSSKTTPRKIPYSRRISVEAVRHFSTLSTARRINIGRLLPTGKDGQAHLTANAFVKMQKRTVF